MLFCNDVEVKPGVPEHKLFKEYLDSDGFKRLDDPVIFKKLAPIKFNHSGLPEDDPRIVIQYKGRRYDQELGSQEWRYCESIPRKKDNGWVYSPSHFTFERSLSVPKTRPDLVFFLDKICPFSGDLYKAEDKQMEAKELIDREDNELAVKFMIYNSHSPISPEAKGSEEFLRMVAAGWGISQAHNTRKSIEEIKVQLFEVVKANERQEGAAKRGFDAFLEEVHAEDVLFLRANIQRAIDNKTIYFDSKKYTWKYSGSDHVIMITPSRHLNRPINALYEHLYKNPENREVFYNVLEDKYEHGPVLEPVGVPERVSSKEKVTQMIRDQAQQHTVSDNYDELKAKARELNIKIFGKKKEDLKKEIEEALA